MLLATALAGCSRMYLDWDSRTFGPVPNQNPVAAAPTAAPTRTGSVTPRQQQNASLLHRHKHKPVATPPDVQDMSIQPDATGSAPPSLPPATISMTTPGGPDAAEKEIQATSQRLAHFERSQLNGPTLATYDQANGFLNQGKQALAEKDYLAASGFAQKASVLVDRLRATTAH
jgi:hypothetical protein